MNSISVGVIRKNEMLIVVPGDERRELLAEQVRDPRDLGAVEQHRALPHPLHAARLGRSVAYSSIVNATIGFCWMCRALIADP